MSGALRVTGVRRFRPYRLTEPIGLFARVNLVAAIEGADRKKIDADRIATSSFDLDEAVVAAGRVAAG